MSAEPVGIRDQRHPQNALEKLEPLLLGSDIASPQSPRWAGIMRGGTESKPQTIGHAGTGCLCLHPPYSRVAPVRQKGAFKATLGRTASSRRKHQGAWAQCLLAQVFIFQANGDEGVQPPSL